MTISPPPIYESLAEGNGKPRLPWILFFNEIFSGDTGTAFTPAFTGLTTVGTPSIIGRYYRNGQFIDWWVKIVASTSTSATAGTTFIASLPFTMTTDAPCFVVTGTTGAAVGVCQASSNRIYVPSWTTVSALLTLSGRVEAK